MNLEKTIERKTNDGKVLVERIMSHHLDSNQVISMDCAIERRFAQQDTKIPYVWFVRSKDFKEGMFNQLITGCFTHALIIEMNKEEMLKRVEVLESDERTPDAVLIDGKEVDLLKILQNEFIQTFCLVPESEEGQRGLANQIVIGKDYLLNIKCLDLFLQHLDIGFVPPVFFRSFLMAFYPHKIVITPLSNLNVVWANQVRPIFEKITSQRVVVDMKLIDLLDSSGLMAIASLEHKLRTSGGILALSNLSQKAKVFIDAAKEAFPRSAFSRLRVSSLV